MYTHSKRARNRSDRSGGKGKRQKFVREAHDTGNGGVPTVLQHQRWCSAKRASFATRESRYTFKRSVRAALERKSRLILAAARQQPWRREDVRKALDLRDKALHDIAKSIDDYLLRVKARFDLEGVKVEIISFAREAEKLVQAQILKVSAGYTAASRSELGKDKSVEMWGPRHQRAGVPKPKSGVVRFVGTDATATAGVKNESSALARKYARFDVSTRDNAVWITVARCPFCSAIYQPYHDESLQQPKPIWPGDFQPWNNRWCRCQRSFTWANRGRKMAKLWEYQCSLERPGGIADWIRASRTATVRELQSELGIYLSTWSGNPMYEVTFATHTLSSDTWKELSNFVPRDDLVIERVRIQVR